jgi:hypothetical protein
MALVGLLGLGWSGLALAQATSITTNCPASFTCAFSAAETLSLVASSPGQPDVYVGYMAFGASDAVTMTGMQNINGAVSSIGTGTPAVLSGTCAPGVNGQPATISFPGNNSTKTVVSFVTNAAGTELQFILTQDINFTKNQQSNSVRIGVCRQ